jgi:hypothetical protein
MIKNIYKIKMCIKHSLSRRGVGIGVKSRIITEK